MRSVYDSIFNHSFVFGGTSFGEAPPYLFKNFLYMLRVRDFGIKAIKTGTRRQFSKTAKRTYENHDRCETAPQEPESSVRKLSEAVRSCFLESSRL